MSKDNRSRSSAWTTLSDSHSRHDLPGRNKLYDKTQSLTHEMNAESNPDRARQQADMQKSEAERRREAQQRLKRREAFMVKRQQPKPILRPSHDMAHAVDRASFNRQWRREYMREKQLNEAYDIRRDLYAQKDNLSREDKNRIALKTRAQGGDVQGATKEAFKAKRRIKKDSSRVLQRSRNFHRGHDDR